MSRWFTNGASRLSSTMSRTRSLASRRPAALTLPLYLVCLALAACFNRTTIEPMPEGGMEDRDIPEVPVEPPSPVPVATGENITSVTVDDERVYWLDGGSFDALGNYLNNGRLRSMPLEGGAIADIAEGLEGPGAVAVTSDFAFVWITRHVVPATGALTDGLLRISLATGTSEIVAVPLGGFAGMLAHRDRLYFDGHPIRVIGEDDPGLAELPSELDRGGNMRADGDFLYFSADYFSPMRGDVCRVPLTGGPCSMVSIGAYDSFTVIDGEIFGVSLSMLKPTHAAYRNVPLTLPRAFIAFEGTPYFVRATSAQLYVAVFNETWDLYAVDTGSETARLLGELPSEFDLVTASRVGVFYVAGWRNAEDRPGRYATELHRVPL